MEYAKLIDAAKKRHGCTDYAIAKALKYKSISAIYKVRKGTCNMSAARYRALLLLANGENKDGSLYIMSSPRRRTLDLKSAANDEQFTLRYAS